MPQSSHGNSKFMWELLWTVYRQGRDINSDPPAHIGTNEPRQSICIQIYAPVKFSLSSAHLLIFWMNKFRREESFFCSTWNRFEIRREIEDKALMKQVSLLVEWKALCVAYYPSSVAWKSERSAYNSKIVARFTGSPHIQPRTMAPLPLEETKSTQIAVEATTIELLLLVIIGFLFLRSSLPSVLTHFER